jgi:phenylpropionate dioxygenase-like ring-hydroxylating dioxygenase large terminal subunit
MIKNQWYVVLESNEVKRKKLLSVKRLGKKLVVWRDTENQVRIVEDRCPHMGASLSQAAFCEGRIECAFHGLQFDGSGVCTYVPALGRTGKIPIAMHVHAYSVHEEHGFIWMWYGDGSSKPVNPPKFFESIDDRFSYSSLHQKWNIHYSRMAENQLDVMHLPFVHATTIGKSGKRVVDGPFVETDGDRINVWVMNRHENGEPARKASTITKPERHPGLQFQFPNLWHNWISDDVRVLAAFVPVDEENSIFYGRFYQCFNQIPALRYLVNLSGKLGSHVIAWQDHRVVTKMKPPASSLTDGDILLQSDNAVSTYRRMRKKMQEAE